MLKQIHEKIEVRCTSFNGIRLDDNTQLEEMFQEVITAFDIDKHGYALSDLRNSIKSHERSRRSEDKGIPTTVGRLDQPLPVEMKKFCPLSSNKVSFQQIFIKWVTENQPDSRCIYLGGSHKDDETICVRVENRNCTVERLLHCSH